MNEIVSNEIINNINTDVVTLSTINDSLNILIVVVVVFFVYIFIKSILRINE